MSKNNVTITYKTTNKHETIFWTKIVTKEINRKKWAFIKYHVANDLTFGHTGYPFQNSFEEHLPS